MPEYKKKRISRLKGGTHFARRSRVAGTEPSDIAMSPSGRKKKESAEKQHMRVVKGKKLERRRRFRGFAVLAAALAAVCLLLEWVLPGGIVENARNAVALVGSGGYPIELGGTDTINAVSRGNYYYVLTNTELTAFANSGKKIYSFAHGFEEPILKTSKTRAMVFSQGGHEGAIYHLGGLAITFQTDEDILTAAISDSGVYAVVTKSASYASTVRVYSKRSELLYEWNSAEESVNSVAIAPNGKKIAVSAFQAASGAYSTRLAVLNFRSAQPEFSKTAESALIYEVDSFGKGFFAIGENQVDFIGWKNEKNKEYRNDYSLSRFKIGKREAVAVFGRESDKTDNRIAIFSANGRCKAEFEFRGTIGDIQVSDGHIYCIGDAGLYQVGTDGEIVRFAECGFGTGKVVPLGSNLVAAISDNRIDKIKLEQEQKEEKE